MRTQRPTLAAMAVLVLALCMSQTEAFAAEQDSQVKPETSPATTFLDVVFKPIELLARGVVTIVAFVVWLPSGDNADVAKDLWKSSLTEPLSNQPDQKAETNPPAGLGTPGPSEK